MANVHLIDIDITDRADGKIPSWNAASGTHVYVANAGASGVPAGTSFPASPSTNDLYFRTDRGILYFYDGTRWLSLTLYQRPMPPSITGAISTNTTAERGPSISDFASIYVVEWHALATVNSTNNASNYWTYTLRRVTAAGVGNTLATVNTSADSAGQFTAHAATGINTVVTSSDPMFDTQTTKTGSPGTTQVWSVVFYRLVG
jgi:hypothetical protein